MGDRLKLIRKELNMTQEQLAQYFGIGKAALSMIETGKTGLSARHRNVLVQEFNVNPEWLESGRGRMFNAPPEMKPFVRRTDSALPQQSVPLYSIEGTAGLVPLFADSAAAKILSQLLLRHVQFFAYKFQSIAHSDVIEKFYSKNLTFVVQFLKIGYIFVPAKLSNLF